MKTSELFLKNGTNNRLGEPARHGVGAEKPHQAEAAPVSPYAATPEAMSSHPTITAQPWRSQRRSGELTPLARLVRLRLSEMGMRQSEFCRMHHFDQGLLSKIQNSVITNLSLESALRLSVGLAVPPQKILALLDRMDLHDLVLQAYAKEWAVANGRI